MAIGIKRDYKRLFISAAAVFALALALNFLSPAVADDFYYAPGAGVTLGELAAKEWHEYLTWNGRFITQLLARLALWAPKPVFNIINSLMFCALILLGALMCVEKNSDCGAGVYLAIAAGVWFFVPALGQTTLWVTGSCVYLWGAVFILAFMLPYRRLLDGSREKNAAKPSAALSAAECAGMLVLGVLAGWNMENTSGAAILFVVGVLTVRIKRKQSVAPWAWCGLAGILSGFAMLRLSPGAAARAAGMDTGYGELQKLIFRALLCTRYMQRMAVPILIFIALVRLFWKRGERRELIAPALFMLCGIAAEYAMVLSPSNAERSMFGSAVFILVAAGILAVKRLGRTPPSAEPLKWTAAAVALLFCVDLCFAGLDILGTRIVVDRRAAARGRESLVTQRITPLTEHNPMWGLGDVGEDSTSWHNRGTARYYDIGEVRTDGTLAYENWGELCALIISSNAQEQ